MAGGALSPGMEATAAGVAAGSDRDAFWRTRTRQQAAGILGSAGLRAASLWGWKLPDKMLALLQVLRSFPCARVIHLVRHPVCSALRRTHATSRVDDPIGQAVLPAAYRACGMHPETIPGDEPYLHNAASWQFQVGGVLAGLRVMAGEGRVLQLHYKDVCADPACAQQRVTGFLGLPAPGGTIAAGIDLARTKPVMAPDGRTDRVWSVCRNNCGGAWLRQVRRCGVENRCSAGPIHPVWVNYQPAPRLGAG